ncbi:hypothetical protein OV079_22225 [Nannocystis pusilla]|uniref:Uncharacterized protein n=1 Tax=Nannocystis pusilla TaxID=889268 RepID=A0A9X3EYD4_9BACT|nr:hypothetical protein [Nannocystis pusilla]MCY1008226.1 hypothetical protein [Nannocystis pusilla]
MVGFVAPPPGEQPAVGEGVLDRGSPAADGDHLAVARVGLVERAGQQQGLGLVVEPRELLRERVAGRLAGRRAR